MIVLLIMTIVNLDTYVKFSYKSEINRNLLYQNKQESSIPTNFISKDFI